MTARRFLRNFHQTRLNNFGLTFFFEFKVASGIAAATHHSPPICIFGNRVKFTQVGRAGSKPSQYQVGDQRANQ
jgi:hypothetical protein